ncbi:MAG: low molecular weight protein arginine phosphatase [Anaerolineae bacterium]|uniref:low molecular weight protein arginine phosphatase n=1 Tax=Candidatus Amarolinea dominans TaxID=3140696 RepID=UPI0031375F9B|nr:low molecular weight protein arginine phosphatase [Anaerolineae bacterium]
MKRVLFVCTGNVCRSPMATGLLRHRLQELGLADQVSVASAGVYALVGQPASANAVTTLAQRGIDIGDHVAHSLEIADVKTADIVLVMEEAHRRSIFYATPQHLGKVYLLTEMSGQHHDVKDPYGQPLPEYERCAQELTQLIDQGMPQILRRLGLAAKS